MNFNRAKAHFAEGLNLEPQNNWYSAEFDGTTGRPVVHVSEEFLKSNDHKMEPLWNDFVIWRQRQNVENGFETSFVAAKVKGLSDSIEKLCGCRAEAIYQRP